MKQFGYIEQRATSAGQLRFKAIYRSPRDNRRISQTFTDKTQAQTWLNNEQALVQAAQAGLATWTSPADRRKPTHTSPLFHDWATLVYYERLRVGADGRLLAPATLRNKDLAFHRLDAQLGNLRLNQLTARRINTMFDTINLPEHPRYDVYAVLKALMREAVSPSDGSEPVLTRNPVTLLECSATRSWIIVSCSAAIIFSAFLSFTVSDRVVRSSPSVCSAVRCIYMIG